jgi:signal peptide peptidase SppA
VALLDTLLFWRRPRIGIVELRGTLASRGGSLNLRGVGPLIERAFRSADKRLPHVILDIDSPGGSPVQSELIASLIRRRAEETGVKVHAVIQEVGASGGYWLACAGDEILASSMSVVGSIGVVGGGFGFTGLIDRIGVQRRLYTAGENKARLDPFSPERPDDVAFTKRLMEDIHVRFKDWVRTRRGARLKVPEAEIFDGSYCLGVRAVELGLIDRIGDLDALVRELAGKRGAARVFRPRRRGLLSRIPRLAAEAAIDAVEERAGLRFY